MQYHHIINPLCNVLNSIPAGILFMTVPYPYSLFASSLAATVVTLASRSSVLNARSISRNVKTPNTLQTHLSNGALLQSWYFRSAEALESELVAFVNKVRLVPSESLHVAV